MIEVRNMARIELPKDMDLRAFILNMFSYTNNGTGETFCNYYYKDGVCWLPPNVEKLQLVAGLLGKQLVDCRNEGAALSSPFVLQEGFKLRDYQVEPAHELVEFILKNKYGVLQAPCGAGKSTVVSYAAGHLNSNICILVDQGNLVQSWEESVHNIWGKQLQTIKANTTTFNDVCISTLQLLHRNTELLQLVGNTFGCTILDEAHVVKATTFKEVMSRINSRYRIGTSATFYNKGLPVGCLEDFTAPISVKMKDTKSLVPTVYFVDSGVYFASDRPMEFASKTTPELARNMSRMACILEIIKQCYSEKRRTIIICITTEQANMIKMFTAKLGAAVEVYVGATSTKRDKQVKVDFEAGNIDFLVCNKKLDKGYDVPSASAIILTRPCNNQKEATQVTGRVLRHKEGKPSPVIYDIVDKGTLSECFARNRRKWYSALGYNIHNS